MRNFIGFLFIYSDIKIYSKYPTSPSLKMLFIQKDLRCYLQVFNKYSRSNIQFHKFVNRSLSQYKYNHKIVGNLLILIQQELKCVEFLFPIVYLQ